MDVSRFLKRRSGAVVSGPSPAPLPNPVEPALFPLVGSMHSIDSVTAIAWKIDAAYVALRLFRLLNPGLLLLYVVFAGSSFNHLLYGRWDRQLQHDIMLWAEPLARVVLISIALRAALRIKASQAIPWFDLWGYVILRLLLTGFVVRMAWPSPSMIPFLDDMDRISEFRLRVTPATVPMTIVSLAFDLAGPVAVGAVLLRRSR